MKITTDSSSREFFSLGKESAILASISVLTLIFFALADNILKGQSFAWDIPLMLAIHRFSHPWLDTIMLGITHSGGAWIPLVFFAFLYYLHKKGAKKFFWGAALSFLGSALLSSLLKTLFARPRPEVFAHLTQVHSYSFPSGHSVAAISLYGFLAFVLWKDKKKWQAILAGTWVLLIALSRVYLGVHYPSDVLGGLALGGIWSLGIIYSQVVPMERET